MDMAFVYSHLVGENVPANDPWFSGEKINYYSQLYYDMDNSPITDFEFDTMMNRLKKLEKEHPELITKDSPTQKVGGHVREDFAKVTHEVPLQSLQDVFSYEELYLCPKSSWKGAETIDQRPKPTS